MFATTPLPIQLSSCQVSYDGQLEYFDEDDVDIMKMFASFVGPKLKPGRKHFGTCQAFDVPRAGCGDIRFCVSAFLPGSCSASGRPPCIQLAP